MLGYTKLFNSILDSTIWQESSSTRLLWITMLAMSDKNGDIQSSVPGLARRAGITLDECESGLDTLMSPDRYSRTPDHEGRRIATIDGGWVLLNHAKYRALLSAEERKEYNRKKQAEHREKSKIVNDTSMTVNDNKQCQHITEGKRQKSDTNNIVESKDSTLPAVTVRGKARKRGRVILTESEEAEFARFWKAYPKRTGRGKAEESWVAMKPPLAEVLAALEWQRLQFDWTKERGQFIPMPVTYLNQKRWQDERTEIIRADAELAF